MTGRNKDPFACKLACHIVAEQFGELCETVCRTLLERGISNFFELARSSGLKPAQVRSSILVLIQHNCVSAYRQHTDDERKSTDQTLYEADLAAILQSLRKPYILTHIRDEPSEAGPPGQGEEEARILNEAIMKVLLENGRLQMEQVIHATLNKLQNVAEDARETVQRHFLGLIQVQYIERAPTAHDPPAVPFQHRKTMRKSAPKPGSPEEARQQAHQQKKLAQADYEKDRFRLPASVLRTAKQDGSAEPPKKKRRWGGSEAAANPVKEEDGKEEEVVLWRVNRDEFNKRFRHAACVEFVNTKNGPDAACVLRAMLHATRIYEKAAKEDESVGVNYDTIMSYMRELKATVPDYDPPSDAKDALKELEGDAMRPITRENDGPGGKEYKVHMDAIIRQLRLLEMEAILKQRFSIQGMRIFRLLLLHGQLEQKQIAEKTLVHPKEAKELLYRLFRAGFVAMQEIPRTADHAPSRTIYTWRVDAKEAAEKLAAELYKAALNVRLRLEHEKKEQAYLFRLAESGVAVQSSHGKQIAKLKHVSQALESNLLRLDQQIAIFNDF